MKALIIDRDQLSAQMIRKKLEEIGVDVIEEPLKNEALNTIKNERPDIVFFDPAPLAEPQALILEIKRHAVRAPYLILCSTETSRHQAIQGGCNDLLTKPVNSEDIGALSQSARRFLSLVDWIGDEKEDFPSAGGIIAKSAFNQLFKSAIDRAYRYDELSHIVLITVKNYEDLRVDYGAYASDYAVSKMAYHLSQLRRQSDIVGQTGKKQYALLLQRPISPKEPVEAISRLAEGLSRISEIAPPKTQDVHISVELIHLPTGLLVQDHTLNIRNA